MVQFSFATLTSLFWVDLSPPHKSKITLSPVFRKIDALAWSKKEPQFEQSTFQRFEVAKLSPFESANPAKDPLSRFPIRRLDPFKVWTCPLSGDGKR